MNGLITPTRFSRALNLPISMAQTELRRNKFIHIAQIPLVMGQMLQLRALLLNVVKNLSPGPVPQYNTTSLGVVSVGLYFGSTLTSPLALASLTNIGFSSINPFYYVKCMTPGMYTIIVANNTTNIDYSVAVTGSAKFYG